MPTPVFAAENAGPRVYKVGRVGLDTGSQDTGGVYTATLRTERVSPAGEGGLCYFRRVAIRVWRTGGFTITLKAFVDGVQTRVYSGGVLVDQVAVITKAAPTTSPIEDVVEMSLAAQGTSIEVEMAVDSDDVTGVFLPELVELHYIPLRKAKGRGAEAT